VLAIDVRGRVLITRLRPPPAPARVASEGKMERATIGEVCLGAREAARFSTLVPSNADFDRPGRDFPLPNPVRSAILASKPAGNLANVGLSC
jgi:hypothetical protein